ncbi:M13 family metallopeptidase [Paeniglutamicibacter psychrophenolicus]|uniref:M13 family metallopeptidase n=1 Tax=Paeniglutamicibacter psychrophenolicus TaxID=257454 RepID=UPI002782D813|nr:M13-type metalloendopeptidase [Paeniglutamicibacter psychrophenolicus]MDQ0093896.1 putative endopeptidase [Paeniglutamicibacter psychrophenolicus]
MSTDSSLATNTGDPKLSENHRDESVRPQDDLYRHANGTWLSSAQIPADQGSYGSFMALRDDSEAAVRAIIEAAAENRQAADGSVDGRKERIANLYASFMNEERIEASGVEPIRADLAAIYETTNIAELLVLSGSFFRRGVSGFIQAGASSDAGSPERNLLTLIQGGLGLPDESYYREEQFAELLGEYQEHLARLLSLGELTDTGTAARDVVALESALASHHWDRVKCRDAQARYNLMTAAELLEHIPSLAGWLEGAGIEEKYFAEVDVWQPSYLKGLEQVLGSEPLASWQHWLAVQLIRSNAPYLSSAFVNENFSFYSAKLAGVQELRERWKRGVAFTEGAVGEDIGQLYVAEHFPQRSKDEMDALVANLIDAYRQSIGELSWMSPETKDKALEKLSMFRPKIGYPNEWIDYSGISTVEDNVISNIAAANEFEFLRELKKIDDGVDRELWFMYPQTVNAYYHPLLNEIAFPAAILRSPFFDADRDAASNYGAIGAVIGHEIGHGFDDQGSQFDGTGELKNWWTDEDREAFEKLTGKLVDQYDALVPPEAPEHHVNGKLTLGENIGDLGGLGIAYTAYKLDMAARGMDTDDVIDGLNGDQRFFYSWAECWRTLSRPETMITRITTDPHSPGEFRCNQVPKNMDAFHEAFGTKPGDGMWLDPEDRVKIW